MAKETTGQKKTVGRVMHEYKHGELKSSSGKKVKSRKQAIAISLSEAGASNKTSASKNAHNLKHTKAKEHAGKTSMQEKEGTMKRAGKKR